MLNCPVGIRSLAVNFPGVIRTNDYWRETFPDLVATSSPRRARVRQPVESTINENGFDIWSQAVTPYLADPFRGNVERRVLGADGSSLMLEYGAAKSALEGANLTPDEIDLAIVTSLFSDHVGPGSAAYLAAQLGLRSPAWNLESTCSSALVALQNARALVQTGEYRNVLVVVSQAGSNAVDERDTLSWSMGDAAGAFVVTALKPNQGILSTKIVNTAGTCGAYFHELATNAQGKPQICTRTGENASALAETAADFVRTCCQGAAAAAGVTLDQINFFAFSTPTAWYTNVCTRALGIDPARTIDLYAQYANIGPVSAIANLYHAAQSDKIRENDLVLVYTNGAGATAVATVMRWADVKLGAMTASPTGVSQIEEKSSQQDLNDTGVILAEKNDLISQQLLTAPPTQRQPILETYLLDYLINSFQIPAKTLNRNKPLTGVLDSLTALLLKSRIEEDLRVRVPVEKLFDGITIVQLTELLLNQFTLANLMRSESISVASMNHQEEREILSL